MALRALLGPTNTGKTHVALEEAAAVVEGGGSAVLGFPLRLLAREAWDKLTLRLGVQRVALLTGEEKILPPSARAFCCTVESMPREQPPSATGGDVGRPFDLVVVDEIQLCADRERGHTFTDRLLHLRGRSATMVLGQDTIAPILRRLYGDDVEIQSRPRLSTLSHTGQKKLSRLPKRSAIVCFSVKDVYALAEEVRHHHGGAAVVTGALSPVTRNAQVQLFQNGDVDVLVATDAIGMGLNLDIEHVAFAALRKFDGDDVRELTESEVAQIAGRAGRHLKDGTFGTLSSSSLGAARPFDGDVVHRLERHIFPPLSALSWRNSDLDFRSLPALHASLRAPPDVVAPKNAGLFAFGRPASDLLALERLMHDPRVTSTVRTRDDVEAFFACCGIPDFEKLSPEEHSSTILEVWQMLHQNRGVVDDAWMARRLAHVSDTSGDVETLVARLARVRTLTYVAHKSGWTRGDRWAEDTRAVEDDLSDALHRALQLRFVDRLARSVFSNDVAAVVDDRGGVVVAGEEIGRLDGLRFQAKGGERKHLQGAAAHKGLEAAVAERIDAVLAAVDDSADFEVDAALLQLRFRGAAMARLVKGRARLWPSARVLADHDVDAALRARLDDKLTAALRAAVARALPRVTALDAVVRGDDDRLAASARAYAHAVVKGLGVCDRGAVEDDAGGVDDDGRRALRRFGVRLGFKDVFVDDAFKDRAIQMRAALLSLWHADESTGVAPPPPPPRGASSFVVGDRPQGFVVACGFHVFAVDEVEGGTVVRAFRADLIDDVAALLLAQPTPFSSPAAACEKLGCSHRALVPVLHFIGYRSDDKGLFVRSRVRARRRGGGREQPA